MHGQSFEQDSSLTQPPVTLRVISLMQILRPFLLLLSLLLVVSCNSDSGSSTDTAPAVSAKKGKTLSISPKVLPNGGEPNPHAEGFNQRGSDNLAIGIADSVMKYHGGRNAWDEVRFLQWDFFGARNLSWDKLESRVRIDVPKENAVYLLNYSQPELTGRVRVKGNEVKDPEKLAEALRRVHSMFINDAFWLVHQFKLKDSGVTLKFVGEARVDPQAQRPSYIIDQTFAGVGDTPGNRYRLYVDKVTYRINTWQFYKDAADIVPTIETPWNGYLPHGDILLSGDRGGRYQLNDISVKKTMDESIFEEF